MNDIRVCVTGVGGGALGEQIVKALRLATTPYYIVGTDTNPYSSGFAMVDTKAKLPRATEPEYLQELLALCQEHSIQALFPGSEIELKVMSEHRESISAKGILLPINPTSLIDACMDKLAMFDMLHKRGFQVPWFRRIGSLQDASSFPIFPIVFKPSKGSGGSADTVIVQNEAEAQVFARFLLELYPEFIAQEYIGTPEDEYTVGILNDLNGRFINSIAVHRSLDSALSRRFRVPNKTDRHELGPFLVISSGISQGTIGSFPEITKPCEELAKMLHPLGAINIQCRFVNGKICVFEINPRFSGTTSLRAMAGFNEPDVLIRRHILKQPVEPRFSYRTGVVTRGLQEHFTDTGDEAPCPDAHASSRRIL